MNLGVLAAVSAPTAGLVIALIALYRAKAQQRLDQVTQRKLEYDLNKSTANRRILLEHWADDVLRQHRKLRTHLLEKAKEGEGVIVVSELDMTLFPLPPMPTINGKD